MCLLFPEEQKKKWFTHEKDDVTKNRLPDVTKGLQNKMQKRMDCNDKEMQLWYVAVALQCTGIYVKYHIDDEKSLNELKVKYADHPIIGLAFGVAQYFSQEKNLKERFQQANQLACDNSVLGMCTIIQYLNETGVEVYEQYGLLIPEQRLSIDEERVAVISEYLSKWALARARRRDNLSTFFDLIICAFYYLLYEETHRICDLKVNTLIMYANNISSFSDYFWTGDDMQNGRMEGIQSMSADELAKRVDKLFCKDSFIREVLVEYFYVIEFGHAGKLL